SDPGVDVLDPVEFPDWGWTWEEGQPLPWWRETTDLPQDGSQDGQPEWMFYTLGDGAPVPVAGAGGGQTTAAADVQQSIARLNTAVAGFFDSVSRLLSSLPANPISDLLSGALLLVRRTLFNQLPTASAYQISTKANGQLVGSLGVVDAEGDALAYSVSKAPALGTVEIAPDGIWTYTPGPDFADGVPESFTVEVSDGGFNILNPTAGPLEVTVPLELVSSSLPWTLLVQNLTNRVLIYKGTSEHAGTQPPYGYQIQPGEQVEFGFDDFYYQPRPTFDDKLDFEAVPYVPAGWRIHAVYSDYVWAFNCSVGPNSCAPSSPGPVFGGRPYTIVLGAPGI
ncbi:MAG: Ig-like domain-containing protein, partial [Mycobacterium sp.]